MKIHYGKLMADINVKLKDYSMITIECDRGISAELSEYFSFFVPGYRFMPAFKNKVWDGKIRMFNQLTGELNAGLYIYVIKFCEERGYILDTEETDYGFPISLDKFDPELLLNFYNALKLPFSPRDYQQDAVRIALERKRAILISPTGSGKSFIMYLLMRHILGTEEGKILIIVPTTSLVEQLYKDFIDYGYDSENKVHKIYSGKDKITNKRIIISTWQSIYKLPRKWFLQFSAVFGDECHGFKSKSLSSIMNKATEAEYRIGLTGTLDGTQTHKLVLEGLFGPVYQVTKTKKLQDAGELAPLDITVLMMKYAQHTREENKENDYQKEIEFIIKHERRNKFISNLTLNQTGNTLVLYLRVDGHGKPLYEMIKNKASEERKVFFVSGDVAATDREAIRKIVEKQKDSIIVASLGTFSTGINIKNLHNIIFASPSKSQIKVLQSIGRGLRVSEDGSTTNLFDIADDLSWERKSNFTLRHSAERVKIYEKEKFNYKIVQVDLE